MSLWFIFVCSNFYGFRFNYFSLIFDFKILQNFAYRPLEKNKNLHLKNQILKNEVWLEIFLALFKKKEAIIHLLLVQAKIYNTHHHNVLKCT